METCSRRPHRKSRNGCNRCKKRKVKCDELKPSCTNCVKHSVQCDFLLQTGPSANSPSPGSYNSIYNGNNYGNTAFSPQSSKNGPQPQYNQRESPVMDPNLQQPYALNMEDLELIHNFCTSTCYTFHNDPNIKTLWRINVPQLAFNFDFVMRGVLALSAVHLAYFKPQKREFFMRQSQMHHQIGLRQATAILPHVNAETCTAIYIFTAMTCFHTLAGGSRGTEQGEFLVVNDTGLAEWLTLFRGTRSIVEPWADTLREGVLGTMFINGGRRSLMRNSVTEAAEETAHLDDLERQISSTLSKKELLPIYQQAIDELRKTYNFIYAQTPQMCESSDVFIWLFQVAEEYLMLLRERTQEAMAVFAHFCVVPKRLEANWWIGGWSTQLISNLYPHLDEEHRLWIRWPIEEIGWVAS